MELVAVAPILSVTVKVIFFGNLLVNKSFLLNAAVFPILPSIAETQEYVYGAVPPLTEELKFIISPFLNSALSHGEVIDAINIPAAITVAVVFPLTAPLVAVTIVVPAATAVNTPVVPSIVPAAGVPLVHVIVAAIGLPN